MAIALMRQKVVINKPTPQRERKVLREAVPAVLRGRVCINPDMYVKEFFNLVDGEEVYSNTVLMWSYPNVYADWHLLHYMVAGPALDLVIKLIAGLEYGGVTILTEALEKHFMAALIGHPHYLEVVGKDSLLNPDRPIPHMVSSVVPEGMDLGYVKLDEVPKEQLVRLRFGFDSRMAIKLVSDPRFLSNEEDLQVVQRGPVQARLHYARPLKEWTTALDH